VTRTLRDLGTGPRLLLRGFVLVARTPRLLLLGLLPALLTALLLVSVVVALLFVVGDLVTWATPFADDWSSGVRSVVRFALAAALVGGVVVIGVITFVSVTLTIGSPFYERISSRADETLGGPPEPNSEPAPGTPMEMLRPILTSVGVALLAVVLGLVPVAGTLAVAVTTAVGGGWMMSLQLTETPLSARGYDLEGRRRELRRRRLLALSFGVPAYLLCLIPVVAIVTMPAAVAGGTLLARELRGEPTALPVRPGRGWR